MAYIIPAKELKTIYQKAIEEAQKQTAIIIDDWFNSQFNQLVKKMSYIGKQELIVNMKIKKEDITSNSTINIPRAATTNHVEEATRKIIQQLQTQGYQTTLKDYTLKIYWN